MKLLVLLLLCTYSAGTTSGHWYPICSSKLEDGKQVMHEGIYMFFDGLSGEPVVTIEGEADGKELPKVSGQLNRVGFIAAPIRNLDTYKLRKLTIQTERTWTLLNPKQDFHLDGAEVFSVIGAGTEGR